jgi:hypothetical protein
MIPTETVDNQHSTVESTVGGKLTYRTLSDTILEWNGFNVICVGEVGVWDPRNGGREINKDSSPSTPPKNKK